MAFTPVLHSEWLKIRTLRSLVAALCAVLPATALFAALAFGTTAVADEFRGGALHATPAAVPWRGRWFAAKAVAVDVPVLGVGLVTGGVSLVVGEAALGADADGLTWSEAGGAKRCAQSSAVRSI